MSGLAITVNISDAVTPLLRRAQAELGPGRVSAALAGDFEKLTKRHLVALGAARHHGYADRNFYAEASAATAATSNALGVTVTIRHEGIAQRYFGGTITAKPGSALTIPADPEAYGHRAREFNNLRLVIFGNTGRAALVTARATNIRIGKRGVKAVSSTIERVMYWIVKSVNQRPDPTVLPTDAVFQDAAATGLNRIVAGLKGAA